MRASRVLLVCALLTAAPVAQAPRKTILLLHEESNLVPGIVAAEQGIQRRLREAGLSYELFTEHLDLRLAPGPEYQARLRDFLAAKHASRHFDVVLVVGAGALRNAIDSRPVLFPATPIVFCGVTPAGLQGLTLPEGVTGLITQADFSATLDVAAQLQPGLRRAVVLSGAAEQDGFYVRDLERDLTRRGSHLDVSYFRGLPMSALAESVAGLDEHTAVLFLSMMRDGDGRTWSPREVIELLSPRSSAPIYAISDEVLGYGIVGGQLVSMDTEGARAADLAISVLRNPSGGVGPVQYSRNTYMFDANQLRRWHMSERSVPAGSVLINRRTSMWDEYRGYIVSALATMALQTALIAGLLLQRTRRRSAEAVVREQETALRTSNDQMLELAGRLISAQEEEQARIARDLHDDFGQRVASISIGLSNAKWDVPETDVLTRQRLSALQAETNTLAKDLRQLSHRLHPGALEHLGLVEALRARCDEVWAESGIRVQLDTSGDWSAVREDVAVCLYRVAQEALHNVVQHAKASAALISLSRQHGSIAMRISDDGIGVAAGTSGMHGGLGLLSMRERVRAMGGRLELRSSPGAGTAIEVTLPPGECP